MHVSRSAVCATTRLLAATRARISRQMSTAVLSAVENLPSPKKAKLEPATAAEPLLVKKLSEHAIPPTRGSSGAAGYDLYSAADCVVPARGRAMVPTDLSIKVPRGTYGRVAPRSGLAWKHGIDTGAGVIDEDYRGAVGVILFNFSDTDFQIKRGDRVAQLILECIVTPIVQQVDELDSTGRGAGGFGSTGVAGAPPPSA